MSAHHNGPPKPPTPPLGERVSSSIFPRAGVQPPNVQHNDSNVNVQRSVSDPRDRIGANIMSGSTRLADTGRKPKRFSDPKVPTSDAAFQEIFTKVDAPKAPGEFAPISSITALKTFDSERPATETEMVGNYTAEYVARGKKARQISALAVARSVEISEIIQSGDIKKLAASATQVDNRTARNEQDAIYLEDLFGTAHAGNLKLTRKQQRAHKKFLKALSRASTNLHTASTVRRGSGPSVMSKPSDSVVPVAIQKRVQILPRTFRDERVFKKAINIMNKRQHGYARSISTNQWFEKTDENLQRSRKLAKGLKKLEKDHHAAVHHKEHAEHELVELAYKPSMKLYRKSRKLIKAFAVFGAVDIARQEHHDNHVHTPHHFPAAPEKVAKTSLQTKLEEFGIRSGAVEALIIGAKDDGSVYESYSAIQITGVREGERTMVYDESQKTFVSRGRNEVLFVGKTKIGDSEREVWFSEDELDPLGAHDVVATPVVEMEGFEIVYHKVIKGSDGKPINDRYFTRSNDGRGTVHHWLTKEQVAQLELKNRAVKEKAKEEAAVRGRAHTWTTREAEQHTRTAKPQAPGETMRIVDNIVNPMDTKIEVALINLGLTNGKIKVKHLGQEFDNAEIVETRQGHVRSGAPTTGYRFRITMPDGSVVEDWVSEARIRNWNA